MRSGTGSQKNDGNFTTGGSAGDGINTLDPVGAGHHRHDVDLQPAICLDAFHKIRFRTVSAATLADIQWTFSILIILQTWLSPIQGYLVDKFGPRLLIAVGCLLSGAGWITRPTPPA